MKPHCRICNVPHWSHEAHVFPESKVVTVTKPTPQMVTVTSCAGCQEKDRVIAELRAEIERRKPKRDRAAYMRAYRKGT